MINRLVLREQIKDELLDRILNGTYQPGDRLVETQIAKEMGISQSPVREALRDLSAMRFVEVTPYKGARVRNTDFDSIIEAYPVRAALEELAGRLATKANANLIPELEKTLAIMRSAAERDNIRELVVADVEFHRIIIHASENKVLQETWESLMIQGRTFITTFKLETADIALEQVADMHQPIIDCLVVGDPQVVASTMRKHVEFFESAFKKSHKKSS